MKRILYFIWFLFITFFVTESLFAQIEFIENKGQWDPRVKFMSSAGSGSFFLTEKGFTITQHNPDDINNMELKRHQPLSKDGKPARFFPDGKIRSHAYSVEFVGAQTPQILPDKPLPTVNNYFIGNDKSKWASDCKIYMGVTYKNIYRGIDLRYYVDGGNNLKYDFIVHPGASVDDITMKYTGADKLEVKNRELNIITPLGKSKSLRPYTYQVINNQKQELDCRYDVKGDIVKFKIKDYSPYKG